MKFNKNLTLTLCVIFSLAACSPKKTAEEYIQSAKTHIANGQSSTAIVELKNAVLIDLTNPESRLLLGGIYLQIGDIEAAEKELTRSLELDGSRELILPKLFKALNLQDKSERIIALSDQSKNISRNILPEILLYKAMAYIKLGDKKSTINYKTDPFRRRQKIDRIRPDTKDRVNFCTIHPASLTKFHQHHNPGV